MKKIMLVEDDKFLVRVYKTKLEKEGFSVVFVENGGNALALAESEKPDLIILDLVLPEMDGYQVRREIRKSEVTKDIPVIVLSVLGFDTTTQSLHDLELTTYFMKSQVEFQDVIGQIKHMLHIE